MRRRATDTFKRRVLLPLGVVVGVLILYLPALVYQYQYNVDQCKRGNEAREQRNLFREVVIGMVDVVERNAQDPNAPVILELKATVKKLPYNEPRNC